MSDKRLKDGHGTATEERFAHYFGNLSSHQSRYSACRLHGKRWRMCAGETLLRVLRNLPRRHVDRTSRDRFGALRRLRLLNVMLEQFEGDSPVGVRASGRGQSRRAANPPWIPTCCRTSGAVLVPQAPGWIASQGSQSVAPHFLDEEDEDAVCEEFGVTRDHLRVLLASGRGRLRVHDAKG